MKEILKKFGYDQSNPVRTLMTLSTKLQDDMGNDLEDVTSYRSMVGSLQYFTLTRLDLSFPINQVC